MRQLAKRRLARSLGMGIKELEAKAETMKRVRQELGKAFVAPQLNRMGCQLTQQDELGLVTVQLAVDEAASSVRRAGAAIAALLKSESVPAHRLELETLRLELTRVARRVISHRPASVCPACKRIRAVMAECATCVGTGYMSARQTPEIDARLLDLENPVVRWRGQLVEVEKVK